MIIVATVSNENRTKYIKMFKVSVVCQVATAVAASALRGGPNGARDDLRDVCEKTKQLQLHDQISKTFTQNYKSGI